EDDRRGKVDAKCNEQEHDGYPEEGMIVEAPDRDLPRFDAERCGEGSDGGYDIPDRIGDDRGVSGHHKDGHGLPDCTPYPEDDRGSDPGERRGDDHAADSLPAGCPGG